MVELSNVAPHLPLLGRRVERKKDNQILQGHRAESAGGGWVQALCWATELSLLIISL
jgi:hypothetical protein